MGWPLGLQCFAGLMQCVKLDLFVISLLYTCPDCLVESKIWQERKYVVHLASFSPIEAPNLAVEYTEDFMFREWNV